MPRESNFSNNKQEATGQHLPEHDLKLLYAQVQTGTEPQRDLRYARTVLLTVTAASLMTTYTSPLIIQGYLISGLQFANSTAFNTIFIINIGLTIIVMIVSLATAN